MLRVSATVLVLAVVVVGIGLWATQPASGPPEGVAARPGSGELDLRTDVGRKAPFLARFDVDELGRGAALDQIRAIDNPVFDTAEEAALLLRDTDLVISVEIDGDARAYPEKLLSLHEVVNDVIGGAPVAIVWCPLCRTATAFERSVDGRPLVFGVSGLLYHRNVVLFDRETGSLWSQLLGGAVTGSMRGTTLVPVPVVHETFARWRLRHPTGEVLSIARDSHSDLFTDPIDASSAYGLASADARYTSYWAKVPTYYRGRVRGIRDSALVVGIVADGEAAAYPLRELAAKRVVEDEVGGEHVLLVFGDRRGLSASVFSRVVDDRTLSFALERGQLVDTETGTSWSLDGRGLVGEHAGRELRLLPSTTSYWFAWRSVYRDTEVWRGTPG